VVSAMINLAHVLWPLGELERARRLVEEALTYAIQSGHVPTMAYGQYYKCLFEAVARDAARAMPHADALVGLSREHGLPFFLNSGTFYHGWTHWHAGDREAGAAEMRQGIALAREHGIGLTMPLYGLLLAEAEAEMGRVEVGLTSLDDLLPEIERTGQRWIEAELHRARGEILLKRDAANPAPAEEAFLIAIAVAKQQATRSFELRAALSLSKLYQSTGRPADAHAVLAQALEGFPALTLLPSGRKPAPSKARGAGDEGYRAGDEGPRALTPDPSAERERRDAAYAEMPELREAEALFEALADSDEVRAAMARREGRLKLQVAYGKALMSVRGFGAPETRAAFARASEFAQGAVDASARFATLYGVWLGAICQEGFAPGRLAAEDMLAESARTGDPAAAGVAHRAMGASLLYGGAFAEAIEHLDRAVALLETADSPELALRFNASPLAAARILRALAAFVTLDPDRAASEARRAVAEAESIGDAASQSYVYGWKAILEAVRRNAGEARADAERVLAITADRELRMWAPSATVVEEWARSFLGEGQFSAARVRQARPALMVVGLDLILGPVVVALAVEWEARAGRDGEGPALVEEMLANASRNGICWHEAELRRVRGEALAFGAEADPARAEAEFKAAIAIAREQGARAFALRAALSLARLYQAANRPADARAVLAPALEGFAPMSDVPEIFEAQALFAALDNEGVNLGAGLSVGS